MQTAECLTSPPPGLNRARLLPVELHERNEVINLRMEAPGIEQESLDIQVEDNTLIVSGEKRMHHLREDGRYHMLECAYGHFSRRIALPAAIDLDQARALYQNGIIAITLPKQQTTRQRIEVIFQ